jgi:hypothetical protein
MIMKILRRNKPVPKKKLKNVAHKIQNKLKMKQSLQEFKAINVEEEIELKQRERNVTKKIKMLRNGRAN